MAFGRLERLRRDAPMSDINMTPLIDVMLVLLVIFMITAPLMVSSLRLDLPQVRGDAAPDSAAAIEIAIDVRGGLYVADEPLQFPAFQARMALAAHEHPNSEVQLRADRGVPYGRVAEVIAALQAAGLNRIGFLTNPRTPAAP
jgi:biopolymer transport protein ExbD/biopolymer transport protein TolR